MRMKELQARHQQFLDDRPIMKSHPVWATERAGHELDELYVELVDDPTPEQLEAIGSEISDVIMFMMNVANHYGLDIVEEISKKMDYNEVRFPTELFQEGDYLEKYAEAKRREGRPVPQEFDVYNPSISDPINDHFQP